MTGVQTCALPICLILRAPELQDLDRWAEMMTDPNATRYIGGVQPRSLVWRALMTMIGAWHTTGISMFSVLDKTRNVWLGRMGPWSPDGWPGLEVGWALHPDAQGQGYAHEAASACMNFAVDKLHWQNIIHTIDPENTASQRLAGRLGSLLLGPGKLPAPHDAAKVEIWGQSATQWRRQNRIHGAPQ